MRLTQSQLNLYDELIDRGLSCGVGRREGQMCIGAVICTILDLPHGDDPKCVASSVRQFSIKLNDQPWISPQARANGLRDLGLAQLGSREIVNNAQFTKLLAEKLVRQLIPTLFEELFPNNKNLLEAAYRCRIEGTAAAAVKYAADAAFNAADAFNAAAAAAYAAAYAAAAGKAAAFNAAADADKYAAAGNAAAAVNAAAYAAFNAADADKYRILAAKLAIEVLRELKSPGCQYIH